MDPTDGLGPGTRELDAALRHHADRLDILTELTTRTRAELEAIARNLEVALPPALNGPSLDQVRTLLVDVLTHDLEVLVDVEPAGPVVNVIGRKFDLHHDHGVQVVLKLFGVEVRRVGQAAVVRASVTET